MSKTAWLASTVTLCVSVTAAPMVALAYTGQELTPQAKVTLDEARAIALKARPGKITDEELEKEGGGSGLRYSFDIKTGNKIFEVGVDARSAKVLENKAEGPHPD